MLPSQSPRTPSRRASTRRRHHLARRLILLLVVGMAGTAVVWAIRDDGDEAGGVDALAEAMQAADSSRAGQAAPDRDRDQPLLSRTGELVRPTGAEDDAAAARHPKLTMGEAVPDETLARPEAVAEATPAPTPLPATARPPAPETREPETRVPEIPAPEPRSEPASPIATTPRVVALLDEGRRLIASGRPLEARIVMSEALRGGRLDEPEAAAIRRQLTELSDRLVFSPQIVDGDPFTVSYVVQSGDTLDRITKKMGLQVNWRFIQRINDIKQAHRIKAGDRLKLATGTFHAVVNKRDFRLDLYMSTDKQIVYVRSFPVGLGADGRTPPGLYCVREDSKLTNPEWVNPQTGERFTADDPLNPIGEYWLGLQGLEDRNRDLLGYGIHGTIDPDSIGEEMSMGCVRLRNEDVAIVWETLTETISRVQIVESY